MIKFSQAGGLVPDRFAGLRDFKEEVAMASGGNSSGNSGNSGHGGASGGSTAKSSPGGPTNANSVGNDAGTGRNGANLGGTHPVSGTELPSSTGAGEGNVTTRRHR